MPFPNSVLPSFKQCIDVALSRRASSAFFVLLELGYPIFQSITTLLFLYFFESATMRPGLSIEIHKVQMFPAAWLYSSVASVLVTAIAVIGWLLTLFFLYMGLAGTVRHPKAPGLYVLMVVLLGIIILNVPYLDLYRHGLWTVEVTSTSLKVDYSTLFTRKAFFISELNELKEVCVEQRTILRWWHTLNATFLYKDGRWGRISVGGLRLGSVKKSLEGLQQELLSSYKLVADRAGANYIENPSTSHPPPPQPAINKSSIGESLRSEISKVLRTLDISSAPFLSALRFWIIFISMATRFRWARASYDREAKGCISGSYIFFEGLLGGLIRAMFLYLLPGHLLALSLHSLLALVKIPAVPADLEIPAIGFKLALLFTLIDALSISAAIKSPGLTIRRIAIGLPYFYYLNLTMVWLIGWLLIAAGKARSTNIAASFGLFLPPSLWSSLVKNIASFAFLLAFSAVFCAATTEWRAAKLLSRRSRQ